MLVDLKLMFIITNRKKADKIIEETEKVGAKFHNIYMAHGTAKSEILEILGIGGSEKELITCVVKNQDVSYVFETLSVKFKFSRLNEGVAFTVPIKSVAGKATLEILSGATVK